MMVNLKYIFENRQFVKETAHQLGFNKEVKVAYDSEEDGLSLVVSLEKDIGFASDINNSILLQFALEKKLQCKVSILVNESLKPLYRELAERSVSLNDEQQLKQLFDVEDLQAVEFPHVSILNTKLEKIFNETIAQVEKARQQSSLSRENTILISKLIPSSSPIFSQTSSEGKQNGIEKKQGTSLKRKSFKGLEKEFEGQEFSDFLIELPEESIKKLENQIEKVKRIKEQRSPSGKKV